MNLKIYAEKYIKRYGLSDPKHGPYDGMIAKDVLKIIDIIQKQRHSGGSISITTEMLLAILKGYSSGDKEDPIWKEYWESPEGKKLKESFI